MFPPTFKDLLLELGKHAVGHEVASISLLELAKLLPAFQLAEEYPSFCVLMSTGFPGLPIFQKVLVLPRSIEDPEPKLDRVARPTIITNESFVGFPLYP